jgi:hypothetical protein
MYRGEAIADEPGKREKEIEEGRIHTAQHIHLAQSILRILFDHRLDAGTLSQGVLGDHYCGSL